LKSRQIEFRPDGCEALAALHATVRSAPLETQRRGLQDRKSNHGPVPVKGDTVDVATEEALGSRPWSRQGPRRSHFHDERWPSRTRRLTRAPHRAGRPSRIRSKSVPVGPGRRPPSVSSAGGLLKPPEEPQIFEISGGKPGTSDAPSAHAAADLARSASVSTAPSRRSDRSRSKGQRQQVDHSHGIESFSERCDPLLELDVFESRRGNIPPRK
jgi:hypothetical protein